MGRKELLEESITREINETNPVVAIPYASSVYSISLTKGPRWLFTGGEDGLIRKFDFFQSVEGKSLLTVSQRHQLIDSILFNGMICSYWENEMPYYKSNMSSNSASHSTSMSISNLKKKTNNLGSFFEPNLSPVYSLCADSNGFWLLSGLQNGAITLQSVRSCEGTIQWYFKNSSDNNIPTEERKYHHSDTVSALITNSDQTNFLSGSWDSNIFKWDLNTGKNMNSFTKSTGQISSLQYRPFIGTDLHWEAKFDEEEKGGEGDDDDDDMDSLFADDDDEVEDDNGNNNGKNNTSDPSGTDDLRKGKDKDDSRMDLDDAKDEEKLAKNTPDVKRDILKLQRDSLQTGTYEGLKSSDDIFLSSSIDGTINIWDGRIGSKGNCVEKIPVGNNTPPWCTSATWSIDGDSIFVGRRNSTIEEYDIRYPTKIQKLLKFPHVSGAVSCVRTLPNKNYLVCGCQDNIRLYDLRLYEPGSTSKKNSKIPFTIVPGHNGGILSDMYIDPTCRFMVSASGNRGWQGKSSDYVYIYEFM